MNPLKVFQKNQKEILKTVLINLIFFLIFLEIGSLGWYYTRNNELFYLREKPAATDGETEEDDDLNLTGIRLKEGIVERLHPYFGFVQSPGDDFRKGFKYNKAGFISPYEYPYKKTSDNQFIVGVFGGSVASNYSIFEIQNQILARKLKQVPELQNKEIIILSFATGGYKQPQQLLVLNYFLSIGQKLDLLVNLDGFNEVAFANENREANIDFTMPSSQHVVSLTNIANNSLSPKALRAMLRIGKNKERIKGALKTLNKCGLAYCHALTSLYIYSLTDSYRRDAKVFELERKDTAQNEENEGSIVYFYQQESEIPDEELFGKAADYWMQTSILMNQIAASNNILYFHFLQPNQYYFTNRILSEEEKKIAFKEDSPYRKPVVFGYPLLLENIEELKRNGVYSFSAVNALDSSPEIVYDDNCCHYSPAGERILSEYIGDRILSVLLQRRNPPPVPPKP